MMPQSDTNDLASTTTVSTECADFDDFWDRTLRDSRGGDDPQFEKIETSLRAITVEDVTFPGFEGQPIKAWLLRPRDAPPQATVVQFLGNNSGRGLPEQHTFLPSADYACLVMDNRGQTDAAAVGDTPDHAISGPQVVGRMTSGIGDPHSYYYRRLFTDAVGAIEAVRKHPIVGDNQLFVTGGSQGGGLALAAAGLCNGIAGAIVDVPLLCDFQRAVRTAESGPYTEVHSYLQTRPGQEHAVFETLSYFDAVHFAARAQAPTLFAVGLQDAVCPAATVFSAYNAYGDARKDIRVYPYSGHENGHWHQKRRHLEFLDAISESATPEVR